MKCVVHLTNVNLIIFLAYRPPPNHKNNYHGDILEKSFNDVVIDDIHKVMNKQKPQHQIFYFLVTLIFQELNGMPELVKLDLIIDVATTRYKNGLTLHRTIICCNMLQRAQEKREMEVRTS